mgnify:CR=1 FL=1
MDNKILQNLSDPQYSYPRVAYGKTLVKLGEQDKRIVVLDADLAKSTKTAFFQEKFPASRNKQDSNDDD